MSQLFLRDNRTVLTLTEPQVWVLIGVFAAAMFGMIGVVLTSFNRTLTASIGGVRTEIADFTVEATREWACAVLERTRDSASGEALLARSMIGSSRSGLTPWS